MLVVCTPRPSPVMAVTPVAPQVKGKWEAFIVNDRGYGRKRRRVGHVFETAVEAARAYAAECRKLLLEEVEAEKEAEAEREVLRAQMAAAAAARESGLELGVARDKAMELEESPAAEDEYEVESILAERVVTTPGRGKPLKYPSPPPPEPGL